MDTKTRKNVVEFNNGFVTALALFYGHKHQFEHSQQTVKHDMRIYGAADHLFGIEYPKGLNPKLKNKIKTFVLAVMIVRLNTMTVVQANELFDRCKELLMEIDKEKFKLNVVVNYG
jgi:hypothetical protein